MDANHGINVQNENGIWDWELRLHQHPKLVDIGTPRTLVRDRRIEVSVENDDSAGLKRWSDGRYDVLSTVLDEGVQLFFEGEPPGCGGFLNELSPRPVGRLFRHDRTFASTFKRLLQQLHLRRFSSAVNALNG